MAGLRDFMNRTRGQGATSESRAVERAMDAAGVELGQGDLQQAQQQTIVRRLVAGDPSFRTTFANNLTELTEDPAEYERAIGALEEAEAQAPGVKMEVLSQIGATKNQQLAELVARNPAPVEAQPAATEEKTIRGKAKVSAKAGWKDIELLRTFGAGTDSRKYTKDESGRKVYARDEQGDVIGGKSQGLGELASAWVESKPRSERLVNPGDIRSKEYSANPELYRKIANEQRAKLMQTPLSPEHVALLSDEQVRELGAADRQLLIGVTLPEELVPVLSRGQIDKIVGGGTFEGLGEEDAARLAAQLAKEESAFASDDVSAYESTTAQDKFLRRIHNLADVKRRDVSGVDVYQMGDFAATNFYRYPFPTSEGGQIVTKDVAPSGEFMAHLLRPLVDPLKEDGQWISDASAVFDEAIRDQAALSPRTETYLKSVGRPESFFANLQLPPYRKGAPLIQAEREGQWTFPQFMEGVWINRGKPKPNLDLGGLLLDRESLGAGSATEQPISTPDGMQQEPAAPPSEPPPPTPAGDEVSMYGRRPMDMELLAALLA